MNPHAPSAEVVLGDMLGAAADDLGYPLRRPTADRLARQVLEHLALAGWALIPNDPIDPMG